MKEIVKHVYAESSIPPIIVIPEVGNIRVSNSLNCGLTTDNNSNKPTLKIFDSNGSIVEEEDNSKKENGKKYIILRNKRTNKVTIFGTKVKYFKIPDFYKTKTVGNQSLIDKDYEFNKVFGTKRSSHISQTRIDSSVNTSTDIFNNISTSSNILLSDSKSSEYSVYLPPGSNRFSDKIETLYPVSTILVDNEIDLMTDYAKEVLSMLPVPSDNEDLSQFFKVNINRLTHKTIPNICLLTLADGLIELLHKRPNELNHKNCIVYPNSEVINDKLFDNFVEYNANEIDMTSKMKDKAICFIIIIMLLINMNIIDLSWISLFLPKGCQKRLVLLMRVVGATPLKEDKTKFTLKIPLPALPSFQKPSKKFK